MDNTSLLTAELAKAQAVRQHLSAESWQLIHAKVTRWQQPADRPTVKPLPPLAMRPGLPPRPLAGEYFAISHEIPD